MNRRGLTLIELIIALVLFSVIAGAIYQILLSNQRAYRQQTERVALNSNIRAAVAILPAELRELNASDTVESDIVAMDSSWVTFKAMRAVFFVCAPPTSFSGGARGTMVVYQTPWFGLRLPDISRDSVLAFAEGSSATRTDNLWVHAGFDGAPTTGAACTDGSPSMSWPLKNITPRRWLDSVQVGAPARIFETISMETYVDAGGDWWLGTRVGGSLQPLLGPLAASGLQLSYFDSTGAVTATPANVVRIGVTVVGSTSEEIQSSKGAIQYVLDSLTTHIALRNNAR